MTTTTNKRFCNNKESFNRKLCNEKIINLYWNIVMINNEFTQGRTSQRQTSIMIIEVDSYWSLYNSKQYLTQTAQQKFMTIYIEHFFARKIIAMTKMMLTTIPTGTVAQLIPNRIRYIGIRLYPRSSLRSHFILIYVALLLSSIFTIRVKNTSSKCKKYK